MFDEYGYPTDEQFIEWNEANAYMNEYDAEADRDEEEPGWTTTPGGYAVPDDLDDDPALWTGEPQQRG